MEIPCTGALTGSTLHLLDDLGGFGSVVSFKIVSDFVNCSRKESDKPSHFPRTSTHAQKSAEMVQVATVHRVQICERICVESDRVLLSYPSADWPEENVVTEVLTRFHPFVMK